MINIKSRTLLACTLLIFIFQTVIAQNQEDRALIIRGTNVEALKSISQEASQKSERDLEKAKELNIPLTIFNRSGEQMHFHSFNAFDNPIYYIDDNIQIAKTSNVETLWRGGESGFDLSGSGIEVGLWETGIPLSAHQDLIGRVTLADDESVSSHATHTAGTIAGSGINPEAMGMANKAKIFSRTSKNDESEMAMFAMNGGLISNHSYRFSEPEENGEFYGHYNEFSAKWDNIAFNAPYYIICKSGGNSRNDGYNVKDNGFDLMYNNSCSKNILVVAANRNVPDYSSPLSVIPASFSNFGPTDDWRVKPDITTNGFEILSCDSGNTLDYGTKSGTSMSSAAVAGMIALLQEHFHNTNGIYMRAATVKALIVGTADEAGSNPGPDLLSGWGLLNAEQAAIAISESGNTAMLEELTLNDGDSLKIDLRVKGGQPFRATIAWTDPAGTTFFIGEDDTTPSLVNDLDIRLTGQDQTYLPWILVPNETRDNFFAPAEKGDNFRDNCEQISVNELPEGEYTLSISHKNSLQNGKQNFSLVVNGLASSTAVNDLDDELGNIKIFPVPVSDGILKIEGEDLSTNIKKLSIYSIQGQLLRNISTSSGALAIDVSNYQNGTYIIGIETDQKIIRKLFTVINH